MIKWQKEDGNLNIKDIIKVINILPCSWTEGYYIDDNENIELIPKPIPDGDYLIYSVYSGLDDYVEWYYKCTADGTIIELGYNIDE